MTDYTRRTWVDIDLDAIQHNLNLIRQRTGSAEIMCVVKADAYGHGVEQIALEYQRMGVNWYAVSNIEEAVELRRCGIRGDILILGYTPHNVTSLLSDYDITQAVFSEEYAEQLSSAAVKLGVSIKCHIKADTGMGRIGFNCRSDVFTADQLDPCQRVCSLPGLDVNGIFTHFAVADEGEDGEAFTRSQFNSFVSLTDKLAQRGITFRWRHCCNSGGILEYPDMHLDMVRPGIILYGLCPSALLRNRYDLRPVMHLRSVISMVKPLEKGATVSYGRTFTAPRDMVLATAPIGYADGYPRILSNNQEVLLHGQRVPIVGRVCMDQLMLDVTGVEGVKAGDLITAFGIDGNAEITVDELADKMGTVNYELICRMARRVPRVYRKGGKAITHTDYLI